MESFVTSSVLGVELQVHGYLCAERPVAHGCETVLVSLLSNQGGHKGESRVRNLELVIQLDGTVQSGVLCAASDHNDQEVHSYDPNHDPEGLIAKVAEEVMRACTPEFRDALIKNHLQAAHKASLLRVEESMSLVQAAKEDVARIEALMIERGLALPQPKTMVQ